MSDLESLVSKKDESFCSLILEELKKGFFNFSDEPQDNDLPKTFDLDEIPRLEKLEDKLKKAKEVLVSRMDKRARSFRLLKLCMFLFMIFIIFCITVNLIFLPSFLDGPGFWSKIASSVAAVILLLLYGFAVFEWIREQITDWKKRKNKTRRILIEEGEQKNYQIFFIATDYDNLKSRCQKLVEDLNTNFVPMRKCYKRLCNQNALYSFVLFFIISIILASTVIEDLFYNTEQNSQKMTSGIFRFFYLIILSFFFFCNSIMNEIAKDNEIQF